MDNQDAKLQEVLTIVKELTTQTAQRFDNVDECFEKIGEQFHKIDERFVRNEAIVMDIQSKMVTKEYLDDKLADLRGDLVVLTRKEDTKLKALVQILCQRKVISEEDKKQVMQMEPFPQSMV